jgi:hypothetical protein
MKPRRLCIALLLCVASTPFLACTSFADPTECQEAISAYKSAKIKHLNCFASLRQLCLEQRRTRRLFHRI